MEVGDHPWYRNRRYLHFDHPVGVNKALRVVKSPARVAMHSFYPLISYEVIKKKVKKDPATGDLDVINKPRPIKYAAHMDSHIYAYYAYQLGGQYEQELIRRGINSSVLAFRSLGKSNIDFAGDVFKEIRARGNCGVVALDIKSFFDNLDHQILKQSLCEILGSTTLPDDCYKLYKCITKYAYVEKEDLCSRLGISKHNPRNGRRRICTPEEFRTEVRAGGLIKANQNRFGIPQGTPISALLSNIYMLQFDETVHRTVDEAGGAYFRYCDDMLIIVPEDRRDDVEDFIGREIKRLSIDINTDKTELVDFRLIGGELQAKPKPLQYLGFTFDGQRVLIRSAALARYSERMRRGVKLAAATRRRVDKVRDQRGLPGRAIFKRQLYARYSYLGRRNFVTYGHRAAEKLGSRAIRKQLKPLWKRLNREIAKYT